MEMAKALFLPLLTFLLVASSAIATIQEVCKTAAYLGTVKYHVCVSILSSAPEGDSATDQGLAVIAGTLALKKAKSIKCGIESLLEKVAYPKLKSGMKACDEVYRNAIAKWTDATNAVKRGDFNKANGWLSKAQFAPSAIQRGR